MLEEASHSRTEKKTIHSHKVVRSSIENLVAEKEYPVE